MYPISWQTLVLCRMLQINHEIRYVLHSDRVLQVSMADLARVFWVITPRIIVIWFRRFEEPAASTFMVTKLQGNLVTLKIRRYSDKHVNVIIIEDGGSMLLRNAEIKLWSYTVLWPKTLMICVSQMIQYGIFMQLFDSGTYWVLYFMSNSEFRNIK